MATEVEALPAQTTLSKEYLEKIDRWADGLGHTRSRMLRLLIEAAVDDQGWVLSLLTSRVGLKAVDVIRSLQEHQTRTAPTVPDAA